MKNGHNNHFQNQQNVQTGEPMDLAWRMLKEEDSYDEKVKRILERLANRGITPGEPREVHPGQENEISRNYRRSQFEPMMPVGPSFPRIKVNQDNQGSLMKGKKK